MSRGRLLPAATETPWFAWVAASALALRGVAWFKYDPVAFDSAVYFEIAALFQDGRWSEALAHDYPPLYALVIAALEPLIGTADGAGLLIALAADLLVLVPLLGIARRAVGEEAAWAAAFLWAVHPTAIGLGVQALSDAPTALCVAVALYAGLRALDRPAPVWALVGGMASGCAFLFRPEGIEPALGLAVLYAFMGPSAWRAARSTEVRGEKGVAAGSRQQAAGGDRAQEAAVAPSRRGRGAIRGLGWALLPLAGWAVVAAPYVAHISVEAGSLTLSRKKSPASFVRAVTPSAESAAPSDGRRMQPVGSREEAGAEQSRGNGGIRGFAQTLYIFQKPLVNGAGPLVLVLACVGFLGLLGRRGEGWNRVHGLLTGLFLLHLGILIGLAADKGATYLGRHHFLLAALYALPVAGSGLVRSLAWLDRRARGRGWVPATAMGVIVMATAFAIATRSPGQGSSLRSAAVWIRSEVAGTPVVVTSLAKLTYHARAVRVDMRGSYEDILRLARERSAHFVAFYPDLLRATLPEFASRLPAGDLELAKVFPEPTRRAPDQRLELYRLRPR